MQTNEFTHTEMIAAIEEFVKNGEIPEDIMMEALGEFLVECEQDSWARAWIQQMGM